MKKRMIALLIMTAMVVSLTACGKFTCALCGEEKVGKKHTGNILGMEVIVCNECYKEFN